MEHTKKKNHREINLHRNAISNMLMKNKQTRKSQSKLKSRQKRESLFIEKRQTRRIHTPSPSPPRVYHVPSPPHVYHVPSPHNSLPYSPISEPLPKATPLSEEQIATLTQQIANEQSTISSIQLSVVIFGHGSLAIEHTTSFNLPRHINTSFVLPKGVDKTNIIGLRYAGLYNFAGRAYEESIDRFLAHYPINIPKFIRYMENFYENALKYQERDANGNMVYFFQSELDKYRMIEQNLNLHKKSHNKISLQGNHFGIRENYGPTRVQKQYYGLNPTENRLIRHRELTLDGGPLVKLYSLRINDQETIPRGHFILVQGLPDGITLTDVIQRSVQRILPPSVIDAKLTTVNVIDLTCNSTILSYPTAEFIGVSPSKKRKVRSKIEGRYGQSDDD
jgi:hypothetical protein